MGPNSRINCNRFGQLAKRDTHECSCKHASSIELLLIFKPLAQVEALPSSRVLQIANYYHSRTTITETIDRSVHWQAYWVLLNGHNHPLSLQNNLQPIEEVKTPSPPHGYILELPFSMTWVSQYRPGMKPITCLRLQMVYPPAHFSGFLFTGTHFKMFHLLIWLLLSWHEGCSIVILSAKKTSAKQQVFKAPINWLPNQDKGRWWSVIATISLQEQIIAIQDRSRELSLKSPEAQKSAKGLGAWGAGFEAKARAFRMRGALLLKKCSKSFTNHICWK